MVSLSNHERVNPLTLSLSKGERRPLRLDNKKALSSLTTCTALA
ncbi:MAG TPA: hypothetical protein VJ256_00840 [Dehalococcoidia bacterium]|nr:hypothetical protein [Dehalococcoidia bacterium]